MQPRPANSCLSAVEVDELRAKLLGYEAFKEARTLAHEGDAIWEFYDAKLWRGLVAANDRVKCLERVLDVLHKASSDALSWWENHPLFDPDDSTFLETLDVLRAALSLSPAPDGQERPTGDKA